MQFSGVESLAVKRKFYVCYNTMIFGVCNSVRLIVPVLKSVARKGIVEAVID
jgi:hypothetical protein